MEKFKQLNKIKELYDRGENIINYLKETSNTKINTIEDILISYDFQSGSYVKLLSKNKNLRQKYCEGLSNIMNDIDKVDSIIEVGVGEAITLGPLIKTLKNRPASIFGFDISWSRLKYAKAFLEDIRVQNVQLFTANLFQIPLMDSSVDVVYTLHSLEPNGGKEEEALKELYRIAKKYIILIEPSYEFSGEKERERMDAHGYVKDLYNKAIGLGYNVIDNRPFEYSANPNNPSGLIIIKKDSTETNASELVCPVTKTEINYYNENLLFSQKSFLAYPVIDGIPCLLEDNAVLASHLLTDYDEFKRLNNINFQ